MDPSLFKEGLGVIYNLSCNMWASFSASKFRFK